MKLLVGYASKEGQSRKIARYVADRMVDSGHAVELVALRDADDIGLSRFDRIALVAPVHVGHYPRPFVDFVSGHSKELAKRHSLFLSVSLAASGHEADDWKALDRIFDDFSEATGWKPDDVEQVAGAYRPSQYDVLTRFLMRRIIAAKDPDAEPGTDKEYTDWEALGRIVDAWLAR